MRGRPSVRALLGLLACLAAGEARGQVTFHTFTTPPPDATGGTIGFAYAGNKFVGTTYNGGIYQTDLSGGNVQDFGAPGIITGNSVEHFIGAALGYGGFNNHDLYVAQDNTVIHIANDGSSSNTFVGGLDGDVRGIVFDTVGTFGYDMVVTTSTGSIYTVDAAGTPHLLATTGEDTEGSAIVPLNDPLGPYAGDLLVSSEGSNTIRAVTPGGSISIIYQDGGLGAAEQLSVVPLNLGASGNPLEGLYASDYTPDVIKADANQFSMYLGDIIVTGETSHVVTDLHWNGTGFTPTVIGMFPNQPEDGIFVTAAVLNVPEPSTIALTALGLPALAVAARRARRAAKPAG